MRSMLIAAALLTAQPAFAQVLFVSESRTPAGDYITAVREALATGKPLLVWVGGEFCPQCVTDSADEFVHHFTATFEDAVSPSIVVAVVDDGRLMRVGDVQWWIEGSPIFGHLPSAREVIRRWRDARPVRRAVRTLLAPVIPAAAPPAAPMTTTWSAAPMMAPPVRFAPAPAFGGGFGFRGGMFRGRAAANC